jgi:hypothetical protein
VLPSDGETRTSFSHTFWENPSTSGVTVLIFTIKVYKLHGLSETADNGFAFGIATSLAVEQAVRSGNRLIIALTMSGWAFGWIGGALSHLALGEWQLIALSGAITLPFSMSYKRVSVFSVEVGKLVIPSISSILIFFFSFEPAFVLQLAPAIVENQGGIIWLIIGYIVAIPMYIFVPVISPLLGETRTALLYTMTSAISGVTFFLTGSVCPYTFISIILSSIMIECRDLALNHCRWVMGLLRAQRHGAHISVISLTLLGIAHIGVRDHYLSTKICYKQI